MRETLTPIARRCYSENNDGAHGDPRPTGCEYGFRKRLRCKKCPHWSMSRYGRSISEVCAEGLVAGIEAGSKDANAKALKDSIERYLKEAER